MQVRDLPRPVTAAKADWLAGTTWMGFTPRSPSLSSRNQCTSAVQAQFGRGFVLEYVTAHFGRPNPGFETDPRYVEERERHRSMAGRLVALHRLRWSARRLPEIVGPDEYERLQDMWAQGDRMRWSVAFPIIESYEIVGWPEARRVFGAEAYRRLFAHPIGLLQPLVASEQALLADLPIRRQPALNAWIAIEDEMAAVDRSPLDPAILRALDLDLSGALEGQTEERKGQFRRRAAWLAKRFILKRQRAESLRCDRFGFDPSSEPDCAPLRPRSMFDVHHKDPLAEGVRYTSLEDFALLCPTCHRLEHRLLKIGRSCLA